MSSQPLSAELRDLQKITSCSVANAIESLRLRLRNEGVTTRGIQRFTSGTEAVIGYAATIKIRASSPPVDAPSYLERTQWWDYVLSVPEPRFLVIQDVDPAPGTGALIGEVHANILRALGCNAVATNGAVRDIVEVSQIGFSMFAGCLSVSHAYSHIVEAGTQVEVAGLGVAPGDLLHADAHGIVRVPQEQIGNILSAAARLKEQEQRLLALCRGRDFSVEGLREAVRKTRGDPT